MSTVEYRYTDEENNDYDCTVELRLSSVGGDTTIVNVESVTIKRIVAYLGTKSGVELDSCDPNFASLCRQKVGTLCDALDKWHAQRLYDAYLKQRSDAA